MLRQQLILRKFGVDTVKLIMGDYHSFVFYLGAQDPETAESESRMLMYDVALNLANKFLELNWADWILINADTARALGFNCKEENQYFLVGHLTQSDADAQIIQLIEDFLNAFTPDRFINYGKYIFKEDEI